MGIGPALRERDVGTFCRGSRMGTERWFLRVCAVGMELRAVPSGRRALLLGVQDEVGGAQLLFSAAIDRQVSYFPEVWDHQEY